MIYVSLPPGTIPDASGASILDRHTGSSVNVPVVNGGFDPVAVGAAAGDTIEVALLGGGIRHPVSYLIVVPVKARPGVVRTSPPTHKRDVPLNTIIEVVFSEPMDSASLLDAVTVSDGASQVSGSVIIPPNSGDILRATFVPDAPLAPLTTYQLHVGAAALDRDGDALAAPVQSDFTTSALGPDLSAPLITVLSPVTGDMVAFDYPSFWINVEDDQGLTGIDCELLLEQPGGSFQAIQGGTLSEGNPSSKGNPID